MNAISNLFATDLIQNIGWTLIHSLWQGLVVLSITVLILKYVPTRRSESRYLIALCSMGLMVVLSISTFLVINHQERTVVSGIILTSVSKTAAVTTSSPEPAILSWSWQQFQNVLQQNMGFVVGFWIIGSVLFSLRVVGGSFYLFLLQRNSLDLQSEWQQRLKELSDQLGIRRMIRLAESTRIHAPIVLGYLKPIILLPAGMLAGLSTEQVEMVLLHELTHIRRNDYLVNVIQVIVESIFFFNPFTWMLSEIIRSEREHCCDDAVVQLQGDVVAYATTLAQLEEARLYKMPLGVAFAENKNQLLNRIKRLMEKSVQKYSARERMVPALLLVVGLACASWLTIGTRPQEQGSMISKEVKSDTNKRKTERSARYSRKTVTTIDEHGEPLEKITEDFEGDEALRPLLAAPSLEMTMPVQAMMASPAMELLSPPAFDTGLDTIPLPPSPMFYPNGDWGKAFREEFQKEFKEQFGDFYKNNQQELNKILEEVQQNIDARLDEQWSTKLDEQFKSQEKMMQDQALHMKARAEMMATNAEAMRKFEQDMKVWEETNSVRMKELEKNMKVMEEQWQQFDKALKEQLVKDGYLKSGEKVEKLIWNDDAPIEINGKTIKDSDRKKYDELHKKYFKEKSNLFWKE